MHLVRMTRGRVGTSAKKKKKGQGRLPVLKNPIYKKIKNKNQLTRQEHQQSLVIEIFKKLFKITRG